MNTTSYTTVKENNCVNIKLEDLKVLRRSPDLFYNVKIGQGFTAYNKTYYVSPYFGVTMVKWPKTI